MGTIESVIAQSYLNWELILIDDASTDSSVSNVKNGISDPRIRIICEKNNRGANYCRNKGLREACGQYVIFLDADDLLKPWCLNNRVALMEKNANADLSVHSMDTFKSKPGDSHLLWIPKSKNPLKDFLKHDLPWQTMQPIWKKDFLLKLNGFDENFVRLQDVELHTRALLQPDVSFILSPGVPDCSYRIDEQRLNYNYETFITKWVQGAIMYCEKFALLVPINMKKFLAGTLFQTYLHLLLARRTGKISTDCFLQLESTIINNINLYSSTAKANFIFRISRFYNQKSFRIPGFNTVLKKTLFFESS